MHILALTDIHGNLRIFRALTNFLKNRKFDALFIAGDLAKVTFEPVGSFRLNRRTFLYNSLYMKKIIESQKLSLQTVLSEIADLALPTYLVPGNEDHPDIHKVLDNWTCKYPAIYNVDNTSYDLGEFVVIGLGGCNYTSSAKTFYEWNERKAAYRLEQLFKECNRDNVVLLTHSPPLGSNLDITGSQMHVGSFAIRSIIRKFKPLVCICGHVHEAPGTEKIGNTVVINPGSLEIPNFPESSTQFSECLVGEISINKTVKRCSLHIINSTDFLLFEKIFN